MIALLPNIRGRVQEGVELGPTTWFRVGGKAELLVRPDDAQDLAQFFAALPSTVSAPCNRPQYCFAGLAGARFYGGDRPPVFRQLHLLVRH